MKRWLLLTLLIVLLPTVALAELDMIVEKNYIKFPELDGMRCRFRPSSEWTVVHRDNLDGNLDLLLGFGWTEEEIRARFDEDTLLWEAYWTAWPGEAFIRMERFTDEISRSVWHLRHLSTAERREFLDFINEGRLFDRYDTFAAKYGGTGVQAYVDCGFTTVPPAAYESGRMCVRYINGQAYVVTYVVPGRMAGHSSLRTKRVNEQLSGYTPLGLLEFSAKLQPRLTDMTLSPLPEMAEAGSLTLTGVVEAGGKVQAMLDGQELKCSAARDGSFTLTLPEVQPGPHELTLTASHPKYTARTETYTFPASASVVPLTLTAVPEGSVLTGMQEVAGITLPGAEITLWLDGREAAQLTADDAGQFAYSLDAPDSRYHLLQLSVKAENREELTVEKAFVTRYAGVDEAIAAFCQDLTGLRISELAVDPRAHMGEKVKISVQISEVQHTRDGLEVLCTYNPPAGLQHEKTPLFLAVPGYACDRIRPGMIMTIYASVHGQEWVDGEPRMVLLVDYGTWLTGE